MLELLGIACDETHRDITTANRAAAPAHAPVVIGMHKLFGVKAH